MAQGYAADPAGRPPLHLGYGDRDPFAPANRLLAELLPPGRVVTTPGGHDWPTWKRLWDALFPAVAPGEPATARPGMP